MRAALFEKVGEPLRVVDDVTVDDPGPGDVRVRVTHCGLCHSDLSVVDGTFPAPTPMVLGHEAAGVVEDVGAGVRHLSPGDHVVLSPAPPCGRCYWCARGEPGACVNTVGISTGTLPDGTTPLSRDGSPVFRGLNLGALCEHVVLPAAGAVQIPDDVPLDVACVVGCAVQTGVGAVLNTARVEEGATVLVLGLGGIGLSIVQGARLAAASRVIVSDPNADRRAVAMALGATDAIDPTETDVVTFSRDVTGGIGVDYAFDAVGRAALVSAGIAATRNGGTTVLVGAAPMDQTLEIPMYVAFAASERKLLGCLLGSSNAPLDIPRLVGLHQAGRLDLAALVTARRPLDEVNEGFADLAAGRGVRTVLSLAGA